MQSSLLWRSWLRDQGFGSIARICGTGLFGALSACSGQPDPVDESNSGDEGIAVSDADGESDSEGPSAGDGPSLADDGDSGDSGGDAGSGDDGDGDGGEADGGGDGLDDIRFDLGPLPDGPKTCNGPDLRFIWIANSDEGTVSKIDTVSGVELGRYWTHPQKSATASPSRTSVNLMGDVAVSNRGLASTTKISALSERCIDRNGNGMIDTSSGPTDVLDWGEDECVHWHVEFPMAGDQTRGPRPTQWEGGKNSGNPCMPDPNPRLWVGYGGPTNGGGGGLFGTAYFDRIDGDTGAVLDHVEVDDWRGGIGYGPYGGVVNAEGDLWATGIMDSPLYHIDADTLEVTVYDNPGVQFYGIGIDPEGNPWVAGYDSPGKVGVFDHMSEQWQVINLARTGTLRGIQIDREGRAWVAANGPCALVELDVATRSVVREDIALPGCRTPVGISIDAEGHVWIPDQLAELAYKVDPTSHDVELQVEGLVGPYTYSDMTGATLGLVTDPPGR